MNLTAKTMIQLYILNSHRYQIISIMYLDYSLRGKNGTSNGSNNEILYSALNTTDKNTGPAIQNNPIQNKFPSSQEFKVEPNRPNSSSQVYIHDLRTNSQHHKSPPQFTGTNKQTNNAAFNNYISFLQNRSQIPKQQKQIPNPPIAGNNRAVLNISEKQMYDNGVNGVNGDRYTDSKLLEMNQQQRDEQKQIGDFPQISIKEVTKDDKANILGCKQPYTYQKYQKGAVFNECANTKFSSYQLQSDKKNNLTLSYAQKRPEDSNSKNVLISSVGEGLLKKDMSRSTADKKYSYYRTSDFNKHLEVNETEQTKNINLQNLLEQRGVRMINEQKIVVQTHDMSEVAAKHIQFQRDIEEKNKEICLRNKELSEKSRVIIDKNRQIQSLSAKLVVKNEELLKSSSQWSNKQKQYLQTISLIQSQSRKNNQQQPILQESQLLRRIQSLEEDILIKAKQVQQNTDEIANLNNKVRMLESELEKTKAEKEDLQGVNKEMKKQLVTSNALQQTIIKDYQHKKSLQQARIQNLLQNLQNLSELNISFENQLQNKQMAIANLEKSNIKLSILQKSNTTLEVNIQELNQKINLISIEKSALLREKDESYQKLTLMEEKYRQVIKQLLLEGGTSHDKVLKKIKECLDRLHQTDDLQLKQIQRSKDFQMQRLQAEHLQRRYMDLNRQLKNYANRFAVATSEIQQGSNLIHNINNELVLANLHSLNVKYKDLMESE